MAKSAPLKSIIHDKKYLGDEPVVEGKLIDGIVEVATHLNWYNYFCDTEKAKEYIRDYAKVKTIKNINLDLHKTNTYGWLARMITRGATFNPETMTKFNAYIASLQSTAKVVEEKPIEVRVATVHNAVSEHIANIDEQLDIRETDFSMYDFLQSNNIGPNYAKQIQEYYTPQLEEVKAAYNKEDAQLVEGYKKYSRKELKEFLAFWEGMIADCERHLGNVKAERKPRAPRKPRMKSVESILKHFTYMKKFDDLKLVSESPEKIIGAETVYLFDTSYNKLTMLVAEGGKTLNIHRTAITGYDENASTCKRIGRKTGDILQGLIASTKRSRMKYVKELKGDVKFSGRVNENTIIVKIDK